MGYFFTASFLSDKQRCQHTLPEQEVCKYRQLDGIHRQLKFSEFAEKVDFEFFHTEYNGYIAIQSAIRNLAQTVLSNDEPALHYRGDFVTTKCYTLNPCLREFFVSNEIRDLLNTPVCHQVFAKLESDRKATRFFDEEEYQPFNYSPEVEAFCRAIQKTGSNIPFILSQRRISCSPGHQAEGDANVFNNFFGCFKAELRSIKIQGRFRERKRAGDRLFGRILKYVDSFFNFCPTIGVASIQLGYPYSSPYRAPTLLQVQQDLKRFLNNIRCNSRFNRMIGYVWKLEDNLPQGYSYHFIAFLNGSEIGSIDCHNFVHSLGEYWVQTITSGQGSYYLCKEVEVNKYRYYGDGLIMQGNSEKFLQLAWHISYLCQIDTFDIDVFPVKMRTMGCGQIKRNVPNILPEARHSSSKSDVYPDFSELTETTRDITTGVSSILVNSQINSQNSIAPDEPDHVSFNTL